MTETESTGRFAITLSRRVPAPPPDVFRMWTDETRVGEWLAPEGYRVSRAEVEAREGERFRIDMEKDGEVYTHTGEYREVVSDERLVFTWISRATGEEPTRVTVVLLGRGGATEVELVHEGLPDPERAERHREGWSSILDRLGRVFSG